MLILINLDTAIERRARMVAQLDAMRLPFARVGIDLRRASPPAIAERLRVEFPMLRFNLRRMSGAEVGCWMSHLTAWQRLRDSNAPACTVIEDDLILAPAFGGVTTALAAVTAADDDGECDRAHDVIYLGTSSRNISQRRRAWVNGLAVHAPVGVIFNTWGYVVRRAWVERLFATGGAIDMPIDHFLGGRARWCRPRIGVLQPTLVREDPQLGRASQIAPHTTRLDRATLVESLRRALLDSRLSDLYYRTVYRVL